MALTLATAATIRPAKLMFPPSAAAQRRQADTPPAAIISTHEDEMHERIVARAALAQAPPRSRTASPNATRGHHRVLERMPTSVVGIGEVGYIAPLGTRAALDHRDQRGSSRAAVRSSASSVSPTSNKLMRGPRNRCFPGHRERAFTLEGCLGNCADRQHASPNAPMSSTTPSVATPASFANALSSPPAQRVQR